MSETKRKVYYNSCADAEVYDMIREVMPDDCRLITLSSDNDDERFDKIADVEVAIVAATPLTRPIIEAAKNLKLVHHQGVGYQDTVDTEALKARGLPLALTPEGTTTPVAEIAILMMLAVYRRLTFADPELRQGRWHINALRPVSRNLRGRTVGYIGMGRIGKATAALAHAFGARGIYFDIVETLGIAEAEAMNLRYGTFDDVVQQCDILSLHIPSSPEVKHLINRDTISRMKRGAVLINTSRGMLVDEKALCDALSEGHLGGAGLDVYEEEPPRPENPLLKFSNVVLTPHIAGGTRDAFQTKMTTIFENIIRFFDGQPLKNEVKL